MRSKFAERLLTMVSSAHLWHFYTKSYASHMAFGDFYEKLQGFADSYIESDIGVHGPISPTSESFYYAGLDSAVSSIRNLKGETRILRGLQEKAGQNGLVAILEEIMGLCDQTLYKLENLS